jgi:hypothetical protein
MTTSYPLAWPEGMPRHRGSRESSQFRTALSTALENARKSLVAFGKDSGIPVSDVVFSSNVGGLDERAPSDPGIALWFKWDSAQRCVAVDRYSKPEANLQAIHHILEADRTKLRHGSLEIVRASFKGFIALPAPRGKKSWREVLGILPDVSVSKEAIETHYRQAAKKAHPDAAVRPKPWRQ